MPARQKAVQGLAGQKGETAGLVVQPHQMRQAGVNPLVQPLAGLLMGGAAGVLVGILPSYRAYRLSLADGLSLRV